MEALSITVLVIAVSGSFGGLVVGMAARSSHKLRLPFWGRLVELGFIGDAWIGAGASVASFLVLAPLLNIGFAAAQEQEQWLKIISLGVLAGLGGVKVLTGTASNLVERVAWLDDRVERLERGGKAGELVRQADALAADKRFEQALATYDEALRMNSRSESALIGKARVYGERSQWSKAIAAASRTIELDPSSKRAYYDRASFKNQAGTFPKDEILQDLRSAVTLDPHYKSYAKLHDANFVNLRDDEDFRKIVE